MAECELSKDASKLLGYLRLDLEKDIQYEQLTSTEENGVEYNKSAKESRSSAVISNRKGKGP